MISKATKEYTDKEIFSILHPTIAKWFKLKFSTFTPSQKFAIKEIHERKNVLISSPTGSGKTLSAFLSSLNELFILAEKNQLEDKIYVVYVSPLKALNNDIEKNLNSPLKEIYELAENDLNLSNEDKRTEKNQKSLNKVSEKDFKKLNAENQSYGSAKKNLNFSNENHDISKNKLPKIRVGVRTGDTSVKDKALQTKIPPHILITTPETLAIVLNAPKFSQNLKDVKWIIVDEIHSLAENKRGTHLSLSLERLQRIVEGKRIFKSDLKMEEENLLDSNYKNKRVERKKIQWVSKMNLEKENKNKTDEEENQLLSKSNFQKENHKLVRIGLSATIFPLNEVAKFLVGYENGEERDCLIVDATFSKKVEFSVVSPVDDLIYTSSEKISEELYKLLDKLISQHKTTLIFTNTRSGTERVVFHLKNKFKKYAESIGAHHSSLSKEVRLEVENKLKNGDLKAVVCSTSLELGIDIGYIDLVILLGSPKSISRALQRVGRSGHQLHEVSKGKIVILDRDDLIECVVLMKKAKERILDRIKIPTLALDVLSQQIVGMALEQKWKVEEAFEMIKNSYPYRNLTIESFISLLKYLGGEHDVLEDRRVYGKLWYDEKSMEFGRRGKMVRAIYYMNVGTIPDEVSVKVFTRSMKYVGNVEEEFVEKLIAGDIFVLGGKTWVYRYSRGMTIFVDDAQTKKPTIPRWVSEQLPLSFDLATEIQKFRGKIRELIVNSKKEKVIEFLLKEYSIDKKTANAIYNYFLEQIRFAEIPTDKEILIEEFRDENGLHNYIFHTLIGRRGNNALSRAFAYQITKVGRTNVRVMVSDNGFVLTLPSYKKLSYQYIRFLINSQELEKNLKNALTNTEMLKRRFRHVSARAFLILKRYLGRHITVGRQQMYSHILFHTLQKYDAEFPILKEVYREIIEDSMDIENAKKFLEDIEKGEIKIRYLDKRTLPSPFAFNLVVQGYSDTVLMEDRKEMIKQMHERVMREIGRRK